MIGIGIELWFVYALAAALVQAVIQILNKYLTNFIDPRLLPALKRVISGTSLLVISFFIFELFLPLSFNFWIFIGILASIDITAAVIYFKGLKRGEISQLASFQTALLAFFPFLIGITFLSESVSILSGIGVLILSLGAYTVISDGKFSFKDKNRALILIFVASLLWSIYGITAKLAVDSFPPYLLAIFVFYLDDIYVWGYNLESNRKGISGLKKIMNPKLVALVLLAGFCTGLGSLLTFFALKLGKASLALPVVYSSPLYVVLLSGRILKEKNIKIRLLGASMVILGVSMIYMF